MASQMAPKKNAGDLTVYMRDLKRRETIPHRVVLLKPPNFETKIGRGSQAEQLLHPQAWNTWFSSRVMSREHAILRADPVTKTITVEDTGSMHGTYVGGVRIAPGQKTSLQLQDTIQFGTEIIRGDQTYKPLELMFSMDFTDDLPFPIRSGMLSVPKNTFMIDFSDEENEDDEDVELLYESIRVQSTEPEKSSRTFSVPDSDSSDSYPEQAEQDDSRPSSPIHEPEISPVKTLPTSQSNDTPEKISVRTSQAAGWAPGSSAQNALNIDADEEEDNVEEQNKENNEPAMRDTDAISYQSSEDHESCGYDPFEDDEEDEDEDEDDEYAEDDETHPSSLEADLAQELEEDWNSQVETTYKYSVQPRSHELRSENNAIHRQPSPSDCALPKLWWPESQRPQNVHFGNLPTIHNLVEQTSSQPSYSTQTFSAAQQSVPTNYQQFYCGDSHWTQADGNVNFPTSVDHGFGVQPLPNVPLNAPTYIYMPPTPIGVAGTKEHDVSSLSLKDANVTKSSKVSINNIIEDAQAESATVSNKHKRKAEEISTDVVLEESTTIASEQEYSPQLVNDQSSMSQAQHQPSDVMAEFGSASEIPPTSDFVVEKSSPGKKSVTFSSEAVMIEPNPGHLRKRARYQHQPQPQSSNLVKYFATALAGLTVGAVGTVFGLAALPADYFV